MNAIIAQLPTVVPTAHVVSSKGCEARRDHLHFTPAGYRELGRRYAEKMLERMSSSYSSSSSARTAATSASATAAGTFIR
jgi:hypothetical protein